MVYDKTYPPTTTDFSPIVRAVQAANPDLVIVCSYPLSSVGIALDLAVSEETVKTHMKNAMARLGARNRSHAVAIALRDGRVALLCNPVNAEQSGARRESLYDELGEGDDQQAEVNELRTQLAELELALVSRRLDRVLVHRHVLGTGDDEEVDVGQLDRLAVGQDVARGDRGVRRRERQPRVAAQAAMPAHPAALANDDRVLGAKLARLAADEHPEPHPVALAQRDLGGHGSLRRSAAIACEDTALDLATDDSGFVIGATLPARRVGEGTLPSPTGCTDTRPGRRRLHA